MGFPSIRSRRLRENPNLRRLVRETTLSTDDLICPVFVRPGKGLRKPISTISGFAQLSVDLLVEEVQRLADLKIPAVILFGVPEAKDAVGSDAMSEEGIIATALREIKKASPEILLIADVCFCEYTDHGHCGVIRDGKVDNDATIENLARQAVTFARSGADMVAPSDMMDGRVAAIREGLDEAGFAELPIMSYSAKYASAFYGPFREAAESAPRFGDRRGYQIDPANVDEAIRDSVLDIGEGADILMVKPALPYLDVLYRLRHELGYPTAAYSVSGEYAMMQAAVEKGWLDERSAAMEAVTGIKRAGADMIITYWAPKLAKWLREG